MTTAVWNLAPRCTMPLRVVRMSAYGTLVVFDRSRTRLVHMRSCSCRPWRQAERIFKRVASLYDRCDHATSHTLTNVSSGLMRAYAVRQTCSGDIRGR